MGYYDCQQVCLNGHQITVRYKEAPENRKAHCPKCGEKTIHQCPDCNHPIKGHHHFDGVLAVMRTPVPIHCENCGKPYPWTLRNKEIPESINQSSEPDYMMLIEQICSRFHLVAKQLQSRHANRKPFIINDEYDAQDLLHSLLHIHFDDIRPEEWTPSYAGGSSRVDFLLKEQCIIIEVKKTRESLKVKQVGDELLIDIQRYQSHPDCKRLICFVYDPDEWIENPKGLEKDLNQKNDKITVKIIIVPKGY